MVLLFKIFFKSFKLNNFFIYSYKKKKKKKKKKLISKFL